MRISITFILYWTFFPMVHAQERSREDTLDLWEEIQWEKLTESAIQNENESFLSEDLTQIEDNPIDLNAASVEELHRIPAVTNLIAAKIYERRMRDRFTSIKELKEIEGITPGLFSFFKKFVKVGRAKGAIHVSASFLSRLSTDIEEREGYITGAYPGSPIKTLNRFRCSIDKITPDRSPSISDIDVGILTKKDPGECGLANFLTGFAAFSVPSVSARVVIGDYQMEAAEGLLFWRASALGKGSDVTAPARKNGSGIHPTLSSDENSFFRGITISLKLDHMEFQGLYSRKPLNATIDDLGNISSLDNSGLFRTESEQQKQNSSREELVGCRLSTFLFPGLKIGGTGYRTRMSNPYILKGKMGETASDLWMQGMDVSFTTGTIDVFSEIALDRAHVSAVIAGAMYEPTPGLELICVGRNYPPMFQSVHGNAFGESGQVQNEKGVYAGIHMTPGPGISLSVYYDQFAHERPTYRIPVPSRGNDFLALAEIQHVEQLTLSIRYKRKNTPSASDGNDAYGRTLQLVIPRVQQNYRLNAEFRSSSSMRLLSRVEWLTIQYGALPISGKGILLAETMKWSISQSLTLQARFAVFDTDSFDAAVYQLEDEAPGAFSNPALFGRGTRWYITFRYQLVSKLLFSFKYSQTVKEGVHYLGSGLDEIRGNRQGTVNVQTEIQF
jgi:hypothetical protein